MIELQKKLRKEVIKVSEKTNEYDLMIAIINKAGTSSFLLFSLFTLKNIHHLSPLLWF